MVKNPDTFPRMSGTRQGYSVLSLLFNIIIEVSVSKIGQGKESDLDVHICRVKKAGILFLPEDQACLNGCV